MKKIIFILALLIMLVGCSNNKLYISDLTEAYKYLSDLSSTQEKVNLDEIKKSMYEFEFAKIDSKKIPLFDSNEEVSFSHYEIKDSLYTLDLMFNDNDKNISGVYIKSNADINLELQYSGYEKLITSMEGVKGYNTLQLNAEIENISDFNIISKELGDSLDSTLFETFYKIITELNKEKISTIKDIETIVGFKYNDKIYNKDDNTTTYCFSDDKFVVKVLYANDNNFDSVRISHNPNNDKLKIGLIIKYNQDKNSISLNILNTQKPTDLLAFNNLLLSLFYK